MFSRISKAIKAFQNRKFVILLSESEGEADLAFPAQEVTAATVLFMARVASGLLCLALPQARLRELEIGRLPSKYAVQDTPFYESVDSHQVKSGVSATDRAATIRKVINGETKPSDLSRPGHLPLLGAEPLGLLKRDGHTEAVIELCKLAGLYPAGLLCELVSDSGEMMNAKELKALARKFHIPLISIGALAEFTRSFLPKKNLTKT